VVPGNADRLPLPSEIQSELSPSEGVYLRADYPPFGPIQGYHFFWRKSLDAVNQLYHRPDVCMPGAGWKSSASPREIDTDIDGSRTIWHLFQYEQRDAKADLLWGAWLGGRPIPISVEGAAKLQRGLMWHLISGGIRDATYEVAAVLVPRRASPLTDAQAADILSRTFSRNANPPHR
jgi:hypothetical protein